MDSSQEEEQNDMMSAIDDSLSDRSALSQDSEATDSERDEDSESCFDEIDKDTVVTMNPDYVVLKDKPCVASMIIFSCHGIKIKSYQEGLSYEFGVEDIVSIRYNWYQAAGLIIVRVQVLRKDETCHEDLQHTREIEELKFAVKEYNWPEKQQKINSLHVKYPAVWIADVNDEAWDNSGRQKGYYPCFDEPFEEVIYPKGERDAVSICKRDVELLQPETFVNDTIIDFYINFLKNEIQAEERNRYHFFNSFFFRKLADLDKDPSSISDGKAAFLRVRKWTRKVDMFGKDYIFVPVNFNLHWSLIVICHPGEVANCSEDDSTKVSCILHMDSIKGSHAGLKNLIQSYLCEEWKERNKDTSDDISSRFMNLRFISLELPQQENSFDCGLFLLHYLELFLAEAPHNFSPFKIYNASNFLYQNWFPPAEASLKRTLIEKLIFQLIENRSREQNNQSCQSPLLGNNVEMMQAEDDDQGIEMTLLERSSMADIQVVEDSAMVLRDLFNSGVNNTLGQLQQTFEESDVEEVDMGTGEEFMCLNSSSTPRASISLSPWNLGIMPDEKEGEADSLSETSKDTANDSEDNDIIDENPMEKSIHEGETVESTSRETVTEQNTENEELVSILADLADDREEEKPLEHDLEVGKKRNDDLGEEEGEDEKLAAKRPRLTSTSEVEEMEK